MIFLQRKKKDHQLRHLTLQSTGIGKTAEYKSAELALAQQLKIVSKKLRVEFNIKTAIEEHLKIARKEEESEQAPDLKFKRGCLTHEDLRSKYPALYLLSCTRHNNKLMVKAIASARKNAYKLRYYTTHLGFDNKYGFLIPKIKDEVVKKMDEFEKIVKEEVAAKEPSVIISLRKCVLIK